ncbi:MAG: iron-sulfur cluster assembly accessory protein [Deltaproteobacteria bacterium]|nr:iron-sulfur cluster assembly accessory protein [Deltaproteobacteria bacterium]MBW2421337.1 iron-sulfur cluster assembly accessory protein [Deltaproteobacteria bacterium]
MIDLQLTEDAARKALELLAKSESPGDALRVRVKSGGCSGMRYELAFDGEQAEGDTELDLHGLRVVIDAESAPYLAGITVDYADGLNEAGFKIENPSAQETCGCGESFSL